MGLYWSALSLLLVALTGLNDRVNICNRCYIAVICVTWTMSVLSGKTSWQGGHFLICLHLLSTVTTFTQKTRFREQADCVHFNTFILSFWKVFYMQTSKDTPNMMTIIKRKSKYVRCAATSTAKVSIKERQNANCDVIENISGFLKGAVCLQRQGWQQFQGHLQRVHCCWMKIEYTWSKWQTMLKAKKHVLV